MREATLQVAARGPLLETADDMQADLDRAYGASFEAPDPATWMRESLDRLAKARVVEDLAGLDTTVRPRREPQQSIGAVVEQAQRLADARRGVDGTLRTEQKAVKAANAEDDRAVDLAADMVCVTGIVFTASTPVVPAVLKLPVVGAGAAFMAWRLRQVSRQATPVEAAWGEVDRSRHDVAAGRQSLAAERERLAGTLDGAALPAASRGNRVRPGSGRPSGGDRPR